MGILEKLLSVFRPQQELISPLPASEFENSTFRSTAPTPTPTPKLQKFVPKQFEDLTRKSARQYQIPERLLAAKIMQESSYNPEATSSVGAVGLPQFMPQTASWFAKQYGEFDPKVPEQGVPAGAAYLDYVRNAIGRQGVEDEDWFEALKAYNAGPGNYKKYSGNIPFPETQNYVKKIQNYYQE